MASPGVVADSNGFFHPVGDHAQTQFSIDNQPVTDQQSRVYSNQLSPDAVQAMEVMTGVAPAEYGDKSSLVVHIVTKSGLDQPHPTGDVTVGYGSFSTPTIDATLGAGSHTMGNFLALTGVSTDRYLDSPEFQALHDHGTNLSVFDRVDAHAGATGTFHLNLQAAQSSFDVPNTLDQNAAGQAQHQKIDTFNIAPGYTQVIGNAMLFSANAFVRQDHVTYTPSADPLSDEGGSVSQNRKLTNIGVKADLAKTTEHHNLKVRRLVHRDRAQRAVHARAHRSDGQFPMSALRRHAVGRSIADRSVAVRRRADAESGIRSEPASVRSHARRIATRVRAEVHGQAGRGLRGGRHQGGQRELQAGRPPGPLRRG